MYDEENQNSQKKMTPGGCAFLVIFLGSMLGAVITSSIDEMYGVMCAGLCFLSAGIYAISQTGLKKGNALLLIFCVVGAAMIVGPLLWRYQQFHPEMKPILSEELIPVAFLSIFLLVGIGILIHAFRTWLHRTNCCTESVQATCVDLIVSRSRKGGRLYCPVWEYYYGGQTYTKKDSVASNVGVPSVGEQREILLNPEDPEDFCRKGSGDIVVLLFIGGIFTAISLIMMAQTVL